MINNSAPLAYLSPPPPPLHLCIPHLIRTREQQRKSAGSALLPRNRVYRRRQPGGIFLGTIIPRLSVRSAAFEALADSLGTPFSLWLFPLSASFEENLSDGLG